MLVASATGEAFLFAQFLGGKVNPRFATQGLSDESRVATYRASLQMIAVPPWFDTGLGAIGWSFPKDRTPEDFLFGVWGLAQSSPLELVAGLGIPLATVIGFGWMLVVALPIRAVRRRRDGIGVHLAAFSVALIGLLHSMVDVSLRIPGYAIVAFGVGGVRLGQSFWTTLE